MQKVFLIITLVIATLICKAQDSLEFAQVYYKNAWRIIDNKGNFILGQGYGVGMFQNLCFSDKLAMSIKDNKVGFIDFKGKQVIIGRDLGQPHQTIHFLLEIGSRYLRLIARMNYKTQNPDALTQKVNWLLRQFLISYHTLKMELPPRKKMIASC